MDILSIAQQLLGSMQSNPQQITNFVEHPYSTTQQVTGMSAQPSKVDMSQIMTAVAALMGTGSQQQAQTQGLDISNIAAAASGLLGQNNNSVHSLASSLFNVPQVSAASNATAGGGFDLSSLVNVGSLASAVLGGSNRGIDLSDGFDLKDVAGIASLFLGK
ncbi:MAG: hypothetical protein IJ125_03150 [Atopobiaceae bacterium]|nr:hypothetical protein [Atopobiaceae bacterium]